MKQKPAFEVIKPNFGHSFTYQKFDRFKENKKGNLWHFHPEIELVYVNEGTGKRQIGSHLSYYTDGDLILIGSNLPHCGFTDSLSANQNEIVVQMKQDFLGNNFFHIPEMRAIQNLFEVSKSGIAFYGATKQKIGDMLQALEMQSDFQKLLSILNILNELGASSEFKILNAQGFSFETTITDNDRINMIFNHVKSNFQEHISLEEISELASMTVPSFCRYFKKVTHKTFTQFVNDYRLVHASKLLTENSISITDVCFESGFNNFSHFSKSFKKFTGLSPSEYRNQMKLVLN